ncbi:MAG: ferritin-like domain-containing protein [Bryocella sp.]
MSIVKLTHKHYSLIDKALSRRSFLAGAGGVAAAAALAGCANDGTTTMVPPGTPTNPSTFTDADVLNLALNLEYLEAQFYVYAATGKGLATTDTAAPSGYTGKYTAGTLTTNATVGQVGTIAGGTTITTAQQNIVNEIAFEEQNHVRFLRSALGAAAVPMPSIDLTFFATLASLLSPSVSGFTPFANFNTFLLGAFIFEDVGVTAYAGAAPLISAAGVTSGYLNAAAGILAVEAYHAAYIRTALTAQASAPGGVATYLNIANSIEALRASLTVGNAGAPTITGNTGNNGQAGSSASVEVPLTAPSGLTSVSSIVPADSANALGFARTVNQVHHIVYGSPTLGASKGGFFPNGTNSVFSTTTA